MRLIRAVAGSLTRMVEASYFEYRNTMNTSVCKGRRLQNCQSKLGGHVACKRFLAWDMLIKVPTVRLSRRQFCAEFSFQNSFQQVALQQRTSRRTETARPRVASVCVVSNSTPVSTRGNSSSVCNSNKGAQRRTLARLDVICGPMFSGKTTALLDRVSEAQREGKKVLVLKSAVDNRYSASTVVSHDGIEMDCVAISNLAQLESIVSPTQMLEHQLVAIDEAQFFPDLVEFCREAVEVRNQSVVVAGLDSDFQRRKFGQVLELVCLADSVVKLSARCECGEPAIFSLRTIDDSRTTLVGGSDVYKPACRSCYQRSSLEASPE